MNEGDAYHAWARFPMAGRLAAAYFGGHAVFGVVWWATVLSSPRARGWFELDAAQHRILNSFLLPDAVLLTVVSGIAAVAIVRGSRWAVALAAGVSGASAYATLLIAGWVIAGGHGWIGVLAMSLETAVMVVLTIALGRSLAT
jgi:hypothetical protein